VEAYLEGKSPDGTTKRVITRAPVRVTETDQLADSLEALVIEAYEDVRPGFRGR
jgi:hypothetical protein